LSVITFPENLFYPVGVHTCALIVKKGIKHNTDNNVLWLKCTTDGYIVKKGVRKFSKNSPNALGQVENTLKQFIMDNNIEVQNIPELQKSSPIDFNDKLLELIPEAYLDQRKITDEEIYEGIDRLVRENAAYQIRNNLGEIINEN